MGSRGLERNLACGVWWRESKAGTDLHFYEKVGQEFLPAATDFAILALAFTNLQEISIPKLASVRIT
jgi:hypothetical protein